MIIHNAHIALTRFMLDDKSFIVQWQYYMIPGQRETVVNMQAITILLE